MAETKWTPGPWTAYGGLVYSPGEAGGVICEASEPRATRFVEHKRVALGSADFDEAMANARLTAVAPELFDLAVRVAEHFADTDAPLGQLARDLIAKAGK